MQQQGFDLVLKGGRVIDPAQGIDAIRDVAIAAGKIAAVAPDLRESQIALHRENLWNILRDGALLQNGMPRFPELNKDQIGQIYAYIRSRSRETLSGLQPPNE